LRSASKKIDVMMKQFEENYAGANKMFFYALQFASKWNKTD
jgi:hypothetical protein